MNKYQRIILILGAFFLFFVIWTAPMLQYAAHGDVIIVGTDINYVTELDYKTALLRDLGIVGATLLLFIAFKGISNK